MKKNKKSLSPTIAAVDVKWSSNAAFPINNSLDGSEYIMGLKAGANFKTEISSGLLNFIKQNSTLQDIYDNTPNPQTIQLASGEGLVFTNSSSQNLNVFSENLGTTFFCPFTVSQTGSEGMSVLSSTDNTSTMYQLLSTTHGSVSYPAMTSAQINLINLTSAPSGWGAFNTNQNTLNLWDGTNKNPVVIFDGASTSTSNNIPMFINNTGKIVDSGIAKSDIILSSADQTIGGHKTFSSVINADIAGVSGKSNQINTSSTSANTSFSLLFVSASSGYQSVQLSTGISVNASTNTITASQFNGNASTVTNGVVTTGSYADPSWITSLSASKITGTITPSSTAGGDLSGTFPNPTVSKVNGITYNSTSTTNGQIPIGSTSDNSVTMANITGTSNQVNVSNGSHSITLSLPQSINTAATPTFATLTLSGSINALTLLNATSPILLENNANLQAKNSSGTYENFLIPRGSDNKTYIDMGSAGFAIRQNGGGATEMSLDTSGNATMTGLNLTGLTASRAVVTDSSKNFASLAYDSLNTALALVQRDSSGNFSAGTITASLTGAATQIGTTTTNANTTYFPTFSGSSSSGNQTEFVSARWSYNPTTGMQITNTVSGDLLLSGTGLLTQHLTSLTTGTTNAADYYLTRGDQSNGFCRVLYRTSATLDWSTGERSGNSDYVVWDEPQNRAALTISASTDNIHAVNGNFNIDTASKTFTYKSGSNGSTGTGTFSSGSATISTTAALTNDIVDIMITTASNQGFYAITVNSGTGYSVTSSNVSDGSSFRWSRRGVV